MGDHYVRDPASIASGHMEKESLEHRAHDTLWHRCTEDGEIEYVLQQSPIRQLEDQVGGILDLVKL